ncbi:hypothetical protein ACFVKC_40720, partial [Streptomyces noursei]|uniref:hypothetical protein n=2 Tax=Bacillati TaxID=1783272 RepID=UPI00362D0B38
MKNTQTSLPAPPILQGRAVNDKYPQMPMPTVETISNEDGTGYLDVSWEPVEGVKNYQILLFNGSIHSYWDVPANGTSWTTKGKGMFPTNEQIEAGKINFLRDGSGGEFATDPYNLYSKAYEVNGSTLNYTDSTVYYVRVTAVYEDGASPISYAASPTFLEPITLEDEQNFTNIPTLPEMTEEQRELFNSLVNIEVENFEGENPEEFREELINSFEDDTAQELISGRALGMR